MSLHVLLVDFNSFFASVEQQLRPELRGLPVGIVPMMADSTCCIAASYEAKAFGVKTGTCVADARRMCPDIHLVEARHSVYVEWHHRLVDVVESCLHVDAVLSIDEMACSLTGKLCQREHAEAMARSIKASLAQRGGSCLRCSIGIAANTFLAKTASDMQKPDGLVTLEPSDLPQSLFHLKLDDLCGIGPNMLARLRSHGITTMRQLCSADKPTLRRIWGGIEGERFHDSLHGLSVWRPPTRHTTIGHSHVLPPELRTHAGAEAVLSRLAQKAAMRLRQMEMTASMVHVSFKFTHALRWRRDVSITPTQDTLEFLRTMRMALARRPSRLRHATPLAVSFSLLHLAPMTSYTPNLFDPGQRRHRLHHAIDSINHRFGHSKIHYGGSHNVLDSAPMRIAFTHIPNPSLEDETR